MPVGEGKFKLYAKLPAPLTAGLWRLRADQHFTAQSGDATLDENDLRVNQENIHLRIRSPRYLLPPDQILSTYPPANSFGSYGSRLPQVVIKRRTLPWERSLDGAPEYTPWLALVLIAEGEAKLETSVDVNNCVTAGVELEGLKEVAKGNCLVAKQSLIHRVFPTKNDIDLLAHAREVDIRDTELMMGDDDGFLAVVISNRLPLPGKDENGNDAPVKYLACLINLEGQYDVLLNRSPDPAPTFVTTFVTQHLSFHENYAQNDHVVMGTALAPGGPGINPVDLGELTNPVPLAQGIKGSHTTRYQSGVATGGGAKPFSGNGQWSISPTANDTSAKVALQMAAPFRNVDEFQVLPYDPEYRFPVLLHWSFTTTGDTTFRSLMTNLDSRLLGDKGSSAKPPSGRLPLEVAESGHVGLGHQTREGDRVRAWYRGPLVPHPTKNSGSDRLKLAHSSDQLRIVIPDGREDLSLATAFEIGRLLTLSQPSIIASLMRWRQADYHAARLHALMTANQSLWEEVLGVGFEKIDAHRIGPLVGRLFADAIAKNPEQFLGNPRARVTAGRPLEFEGKATAVLARGLGLKKSLFTGDLTKVFNGLRDAKIPRDNLMLSELGRVDVRDTLGVDLDKQRIDLVSSALSNKLLDDHLTGPAFPVTDRFRVDVVNDNLDVILRDPRRHGFTDEDES
ncbi:hypothetical protein [Marinobacter sp. ANT_B65]|uniref:hypothetical protein n=1 Tax=Marinobacter sp. ANT_B65 TaxID=2039467 RepID=UPI000BBEAE4E|nr:hypothetical protein [Marinobacter sp. ANT_B65]PCM45839.1 hypothetical protein CPA50_07700 [Marinobacter sp. ANT_B65]